VASFVLGVVTVAATPAVAVLVGTGFCGALSTWSTLGYETVQLAEQRTWTPAVFNVAASVLAGLGAAGLGFALQCAHRAPHTGTRPSGALRSPPASCGDTDDDVSHDRHDGETDPEDHTKDTSEKRRQLTW